MAKRRLVFVDCGPRGDRPDGRLSDRDPFSPVLSPYRGSTGEKESISHSASCAPDDSPADSAILSSATAAQAANRDPVRFQRRLRSDASGSTKLETKGTLMDTYQIVRFFVDKPPRVKARGLTLAEAQQHCRDPKTHGKGWFDGYRKE